jgi:hypothetical protein
MSANVIQMAKGFPRNDRFVWVLPVRSGGGTFNFPAYIPVRHKT